MKTITLPWILVVSLTLALLVPAGARADATAEGRLDLLSFDLTPVAGQIQWLDPWSIETFAQVLHSAGELAQDYHSGPLSVTSSVAIPAGMASAAGTSPDLVGPTFTYISLSLIRDNDADQQVSGKAHTLLMNSFMVTGGSGAVDVDFRAMLGGSLGAMVADPYGGSAGIEASFAVELDGRPIIGFHDQVRVEQIFGGPTSTGTKIIAENLFSAQTLAFNTPYLFSIFLDPNTHDPPYITPVPEPDSGLLFVLWLALAVASRGCNSAFTKGGSKAQLQARS